ncbi:hypothetical protein D3C86_1944020 [compost metagenome]
MSLAVAAAAATIKAFSDQFGDPVNPESAVKTFQATFICMGIVTCSSAFIFWQIPRGERKVKTNAIAQAEG